MDEFVSKSREFCGIEGFHQPVDHVSHPRDAAATGMIRQQKYHMAGAIRSREVLFCPQAQAYAWNTRIPAPLATAQ
jgi:hypothetical protein